MTTHRVSIVKAGWHADIVQSFAGSCSAALIDSGLNLAIDEYEVPGVVEIPLFTQKLIETGSVDIVIVAGLIVDHGVYRHEFVASSVMDAIMRLQMDTGIPIVYGILTPQDFLSEGREAFFLEHFVSKGAEAASACLKTIKNLEGLSALESQG